MGTQMNRVVVAPTWTLRVLIPIHEYSIRTCRGQTRWLVQGGAHPHHLELRPGAVKFELVPSAGDELDRGQSELGSVHFNGERLTQGADWISRNVIPARMQTGELRVFGFERSPQHHEILCQRDIVRPDEFNILWL